MGDNLESADDHAVETPSAEHLSDAAVDRPTPSTGTPPSRSNSPAAGDSESTNANLGALQVVSSPTAAHDETWNSFLDRHVAEVEASKALSTPSKPSNLSGVSMQINTILEAAGGFVSSEAGLTPQDAQSISSTSEQPPQQTIDLSQSPTAKPAPLPRAQTHSFVFTSTRQSTNLRDKNVIGVVAAGGRASTNNVFPNTLPAPSLITSKTARSPAVLTPEQVRVHALCAKHAIPAHSLFVQLARNRSTSSVVGLPLIDEGPPDRSSQRKGIDFYMDAARVANTRCSSGSLSQPVTPSIQPPSLPSLSLASQTSPNSLTTSPMRPPNTPHASLERTPAVVESPGVLTPPVSPSISDISSKKNKRSRSRTRKERAGSDGQHGRPSLQKLMYTKYLENDPDRPSFISRSSTILDTSTSSHGSWSSGKSMASLDESITGMSAFGILGSGKAEFVFGYAVVNQPPKRLGLDERHIPSSTVLAG